VKTILVTGAAGFIGFHLSRNLITLGYRVLGLDNINDYYDVNLKYGKLLELGIPKEKIALNSYVKSESFEHFKFIKSDIFNKQSLIKIFKENKFDIVFNLAAQAGVRYSIEKPDVYADSNLTGFLNILEMCRSSKIKHLIYASSSSVYGLNSKQPFSEKDTVDTPISLYAATKKSNELMAHTYSHLYNIPTTGVRFFTVYGPWGRPDMALYKFTKNIINKKPIKLYNMGEMYRDFTYIDDIIEGLIKLIDVIPKYKDKAPYDIFNIGRGEPIKLIRFVEAIEKALNKKAIIEYSPMQDGDVVSTFADVSLLKEVTGYLPKVSVEEGVKEFVEWYERFNLN